MCRTILARVHDILINVSARLALRLKDGNCAFDMREGAETGWFARGRNPFGFNQTVGELCCPQIDGMQLFGMVSVSHYSSRYLNRAGERRRDDAWISRQLTSPETRFVPVWHGQNLLHEDRAVMLRADEAAFACTPESPEPIFLGIDEQGPVFAIDVSGFAIRKELEHRWDARFAELYGIATQLIRRDASLLSHAAWLVRWSRTHTFCGACGTKTKSLDAGHVRKCTNDDCGLLAFPRTDPAVIVLTENQGRCLLARQIGWPGKLHSCLAGFVEPGESAEDAVLREIKEESGLLVGNIRFHATQPWPYPCSLMLGFYATALDDRIELDGDELAEAQWFTPDELVSGEADIELPRHDSIARNLIDNWICVHTGQSLPSRP